MHAPKQNVKLCSNPAHHSKYRPPLPRRFSSDFHSFLLYGGFPSVLPTNDGFFFCVCVYVRGRERKVQRLLLTEKALDLEPLEQARDQQLPSCEPPCRQERTCDKSARGTAATSQEAETQTTHQESRTWS